MSDTAFVTQFVAYGAPELVKLECYDLEPELMPDGQVIMKKGQPTRLIMPIPCAEALKNLLAEHLSKGTTAVSTNQNMLRSYADMTKAHGNGNPAGNAVEEQIAQKLYKYASYSSGLLRPIVAKINEALGKWSGKGKTLEEGEPAVTTILFAGGDNGDARDLFTTMLRYVRFCEPKENRHMDYVRVVFSELLKKLGEG